MLGLKLNHVSKRGHYTETANVVNLNILHHFAKASHIFPQHVCGCMENISRAQPRIPQLQP